MCCTFDTALHYEQDMDIRSVPAASQQWQYTQLIRQPFQQKDIVQMFLIYSLLIQRPENSAAACYQEKWLAWRWLEDSWFMGFGERW